MHVHVCQKYHTKIALFQIGLKICILKSSNILLSFDRKYKVGLSRSKSPYFSPIHLLFWEILAHKILYQRIYKFNPMPKELNTSDQ
jgi:hypothetical protein